MSIFSPPTSVRRHVVVIGGGISGLAAAERLARDDSVHVTLLEATARLGGIIETERLDGFVLERGPDVVVASKPATRVLCERLGIGDRLHGTSIRGAYVSRRGRLRRLPQGLSGLMPTRLAPLALSGLLSPWGLLRVATEPLRAPAVTGTDESVAEFMVRRLGREMYERISEPLLTGIYAGAGARLSMDATFRSSAPWSGRTAACYAGSARVPPRRAASRRRRRSCRCHWACRSWSTPSSGLWSSRGA